MWDELRNQMAWEEYRNHLAEEYLRNQIRVSPPSVVGGGAGGRFPSTGGSMLRPPPPIPGQVMPPGQMPGQTMPGMQPYPPYGGYLPTYPTGPGPFWNPPNPTAVTLANLLETFAPFIPALLPLPETPAEQGKKTTAENIIEHEQAIVKQGKKALVYMALARVAANFARRGGL